MESEMNNIDLPYFNKIKFQNQIELIKKASEEAQHKIDYFTAHDTEILHAISIVEDFLKKKHRICYGGQAINAHLPVKYKFYNPEYSMPDYDIFTPSQYDDIITIINQLKKAGFTEVYIRQGMHVGTIKIYVNYVAVADMTSIDPVLYKILSKRASRIDGISYLDPNTLRMLMYLELSRPRGQVERWEKIFERLMLFNEFVPIKSCPGFHLESVFKNKLTSEQVNYTMQFIINNKRVFAGADLLPFYENTLKLHKTNVHWLLHSNKPIIFFSGTAQDDAMQLIAEFNYTHGEKRMPFTIKSFTASNNDILPSMKVIEQGKLPVIFILNQTACHSYFNVPIHNKQYGKILKVATIDTLITLYFSFSLIKNKYFNSIECLANQLVHLSIKTRKEHKKFIFPFISIKCYGHQDTLPSLIRSKVKYMRTKKKNLVNLLKTTITTVKNKNNRLNLI